MVRGGSLQRFDVDDLRALASASRVVIGTVAHQARSRVERRREAESRSTGRPPARPAPAPARWRFKRRWVVVPLLIVVLLTVAAVAGIWWMVAAMLGQV